MVKSYRRHAIPVLSVLLVSILLACEAIVPYHARSAEIDGEKTRIVLDLVKASEAKKVTFLSPRDARYASLHTDPAFFEARVGQLLARSAPLAARAPSYWGAKTVGEFYVDSPLILSMNEMAEGLDEEKKGVLVEGSPGVRGFSLERWLEDDRVTTIDFSLEPSEGAFRVILDSIHIEYTRAKVADTSLRNWWSRIPLLYGFAFDIAAIFGTSYGDQAIDMQVDVILSTVWTDTYGESHSATLAALAWTLLDVPIVGGTYEVKQASGWVPLVPLSVTGFEGSLPKLGLGTFALSIWVVEQDDFTLEYAAARESMEHYFGQILSIIPMPIPTVSPGR